MYSYDLLRNVSGPPVSKIPEKVIVHELSSFLFEILSSPSWI